MSVCKSKEAFVKPIRDSPSYARRAAAKATPNTEAREVTTNEEAPLESPEAPPVEEGELPLLVEEDPLPLGLAVPEGAGELEDEGKAVAAAA